MSSPKNFVLRLLLIALVLALWEAAVRLFEVPQFILPAPSNVFIAFYRGREGYDPHRPIRPWLFGIAFRVASDYRRRAQHRLEIPDGRAEPAGAAPGADEAMAQKQRRELVAAALESLDFDKRAVFVLHDIDERSMPEIAETLSAPLNTLYSRLRLARAEFAQAVRRLRLRRGEDEI